MQNKSKIFTNAYDSEYDFVKKRQYSEPKIYDAGGDLSKRWFVYYSFRNPLSGKLERQTPIYAGVNEYKTLGERREAVRNLLKSVKSILKNGFNPYNDEPYHEEKNLTIANAVQLILNLKKNQYTPASYRDFKSRILRFQKWLFENGYFGRLITDVTKKTVINYLNHVQIESSASNRNNARNNLSAFFAALEEQDIINANFVTSIAKLKTRPERHKTYSQKNENDIDKLLQKDPVLNLFVKFVSYNFLRPIEVVRLQVCDIHLKERKLFVRAKNKPVKIKIIPEILAEEIIKHCDLDSLPSEHYFFTVTGFGHEWHTEENNRRNYFSKRFKTLKKKVGLNKDYGLYSFRHTFIAKLYHELIKSMTPFEAKAKMMLITGHTTMTALEKYLRDIDAVLPDDYSDFIK